MASVAPVGDAFTAQAGVVFALLATLETLAPGGVAWFNHALFATEGLTLEEVARHEAADRYALENDNP